MINRTNIYYSYIFIYLFIHIYWKHIWLKKVRIVETSLFQNELTLWYSDFRLKIRNTSMKWNNELKTKLKQNFINVNRLKKEAQVNSKTASSTVNISIIVKKISSSRTVIILYIFYGKFTAVIVMALCMHVQLYKTSLNFIRSLSVLCCLFSSDAQLHSAHQESIAVEYSTI